MYNKQHITQSIWVFQGSRKAIFLLVFFRAGTRVKCRESADVMILRSWF